MNYKSVYKLKHIMLTIYLQLCHNVLTVIQYYIRRKENKDIKERLEEKRRIHNFCVVEVEKIEWKNRK